MTDWAEEAYAELADVGSARRGDAGVHPYLVVNMVASVDGAIAVEGRTARLGGPDDLQLFRHLRSLADVILVGAQTARAEKYGPPRLSVEQQAARVARGQLPLPRLAVVSRRVDLDPAMRLFEGGHRPIVVVPDDAEPSRVSAVGGIADVVTAGSGTVDLAAAVARLGRELGAGLVLCEGGPTLNGGLLRAGVLDELCLTVAGTLVGGTGGGLLGPELLDVPVALELVQALPRGDDLFLRYRRR